MKLLAIETASEACSAALFLDGRVEEKFSRAPKQHTRIILPMIDTLLADAGLKIGNLDALAFSCGPGSFTGVRIATGVIQGIGLGADLPIVPVSTLAALAQQLFDNSDADEAYVSQDARMNEVYWGVYKRGLDDMAVLNGRESVCPADQVEVPAQSATGIGVGSGWIEHYDALKRRLENRVMNIDTSLMPRAAAIACLGAHGFTRGEAVSAEMASPVYLRDKVAKKESER